MDLPRTAANVSYSYVMGVACGYGRYADLSEKISRNLLWSQVKVIENDECQRVYGDKVVIESTMCAISVR